MTHRQSGNVPAVARWDGWPTTTASLAVGAAFFGLWFWLLPQWLGLRVETAGAGRSRWLAGPPAGVGVARAFSRRFWFWGGRPGGTPAPATTPKALVVGCFRPLWQTP